MAGRAVIDDNFRPVIAGVSSVDDSTVISVRVDPTLKALNVNVVSETDVYSEDAATPATIIGSAIVMERDDALTTVTPAEADWIGLRGTAEGALWVEDFNSDAIKTAVETLDNAISGNEMQVDVVSMPSVAVTGTFWQTTQPVSIASTVTVDLGANNDVTLATLPDTAAGDLAALVVGQLADGHNVTVDNAVGAGVYVQPGTGAVFTVDLAGNNDVTVTSGAITETNSGTIAGDTASIDGKITACNTGAVVLTTGTAAVGRVGHDITGIGHGVTTVTTAGTDVVLASSTVCKRVIIQSQTDNTNIIAVGATGVDATAATGTGVVLYPGDAIDFQIDNLADIYIDALVDGEGVRYSYFS